jgi:hypothetical protein
MNDADLILKEYKKFVDSGGGGSVTYDAYHDLVRSLSPTTVSEAIVKGHWQRMKKIEAGDGQEAIGLETFLPWYYKTFGSPMKEKAQPKAQKKARQSSP